MYHVIVSAQGVDERKINAHYYYFMLSESTCGWIGGLLSLCREICFLAHHLHKNIQ